LPDSRLAENHRFCHAVDLEKMALTLKQRVEEARGLCRSEESKR
jgi:hypothetical protein